MEVLAILGNPFSPLTAVLCRNTREQKATKAAYFHAAKYQKLPRLRLYDRTFFVCQLGLYKQLELEDQPWRFLM